MRPVYGLNDAPRRWWNRLDKFIRDCGLVPTRADRCTYVCYEGAWREPKVEAQPNSADRTAEAGSSTEEEADFCHFLKSCVVKDPSVTSGHTEERSVEDYPDIAHALTTRKVTEYAWRPVVDEALLKFLNSTAVHKKGWFPFLNQAQVTHRAKALRTPEPTYKTKDYPFRVSCIFRQGTWWVIEQSTDLRNGGKQDFLEEEVEILVSLYLPEKSSYQATLDKPQLTPEVVDELLEHFVDPVHGSPSRGRKPIGVLSLHVDDLMITGDKSFLDWFVKTVRKHFSVGHEDVNDIMFTGQRVAWVFDDKTKKKKKYIGVTQKLNVEELEEISIPRGSSDSEGCSKEMHTAFRSLLGSINWLQSRTQFQACYQFSRCASASASPTIGDCQALNKLCRQTKNEPSELRSWPLKTNPRILRIPDAAFRNNSDKSSERGMTVFLAEQRQKNSRDTRGSLVFFESTEIKRTTLSTTVAELYALVNCFGTRQMLRGLWMDISGADASIHMRTDANNLVTTASTTHVPEQQKTNHMIQMLRKEACSGAIADLFHVRTERCLADCLTKASANCRNLIGSAMSGDIKEIDSHPAFRSLMEHKAFALAWLTKELNLLPEICKEICLMLGSL